MYILETKEGYVASWYSFNNSKKKITIVNTQELKAAIVFYHPEDALRVSKKLKATILPLEVAQKKSPITRAQAAWHLLTDLIITHN